MNAAAWVGLGFVASAGNISTEMIQGYGCIRVVAPQIAWGQGRPGGDQDLTNAKNLINGCRNAGLGVAGWAWCNGPNVEGAQSEARYHAQTVLDLGLGMFIANCEEPYDSHGDQSSARWQMANQYAQAFRSVAPNVELGLTTTPRWASDGTGMRAAGATIMPQCFTGEVPSATIAAAVPFMESWGWDRSIQRPLVQTYQTGGQFPDPAAYNTDSWTYSVGVVPYTLEQGGAVIPQLESSILREPIELPPDIEEKPDEGGKPPPLDLPFARALYPPDSAAKGKIPTKNGPDVEAVKRAISRAGGGYGPPNGYWKWQSFSQEYSNAFSHGGSSGSGVQGFQNDCVAAQPTGWYGSKTHEALVNFLIPQGLPHAAEWAFDQRAIDLYRQAP